MRVVAGHNAIGERRAQKDLFQKYGDTLQINACYRRMFISGYGRVKSALSSYSQTSTISRSSFKQCNTLANCASS